MAIEKILKCLVILYFLNFIALIFAAPDDPQYAEEIGSIIDITAIVFALLQLIGAFLLYKPHSLGRGIFALSTLGAFACLPFMSEYSIPDGVVLDALSYMGGAIDGSIISIIYLSELRTKFT